MNRYKKLLNNSLIFTIGNLGSKFITFIMLPLYTYKLSTSDYGTVDLLTTTVSLLLPLVSLSIADSVLRFAMDKEEDLRKLYSNSIWVINISNIALLILGIIAYLLRPIFTFLPILLILQNYQNLFPQYAKGTGEVKIFAANGIVLTLLTALLNVVFLIGFNLGLYGYLWSTALALLLSDLFLFIVLRLKTVYQRKLVEYKYIRKQLKYCIPLIPNAMAWWLTTSVGRYFILFFIGASANGIFAVSNKIPTLLTTFTSIFSQSWQLSAIEEFDSENREKFFNNVYTIYAQTLLIGTSILVIFLKPIFKVLVSNSFYDAWQYVPLLLISVIFSCLSAFLGSQYVAAKETKGIMTTTIYGAIVNLIADLILIPTIGLNGVSIGSGLGFMVVWVIREKQLQKIFPLKLHKIRFFLSIIIILLQYLLLNVLSGFTMYLLNFSILMVLIFINKESIVNVFRKD